MIGEIIGFAETIEDERQSWERAGRREPEYSEDRLCCSVCFMRFSCVRRDMFLKHFTFY